MYVYKQKGKKGNVKTDTHIYLVSQLSQSSYLSLQTPYCLIGLGRTNNYVEEMFAGVSRHQVL